MKHSKRIFTIIVPFFALSFLGLNADDSWRKKLKPEKEQEQKKPSLFLQHIDPVKEAGNFRLFISTIDGLPFSWSEKLTKEEQGKLAQWAALVSTWCNMLGEAVNHEVINSMNPGGHIDVKWLKRIIGFVSGGGILSKVQYITPDVNVDSDEYHNLVLSGLKALRKRIEAEESGIIREELACQKGVHPLIVAQANTFDSFFFAGDKLKRIRLNHLNELITNFKKLKKGGNDDDGGGSAPAALSMGGDGSTKSAHHGSERGLEN